MYNTHRHIKFIQPSLIDTYNYYWVGGCTSFGSMLAQSGLDLIFSCGRYSSLVRVVGHPLKPSATIVSYSFFIPDALSGWWRIRLYSIFRCWVYFFISLSLSFFVCGSLSEDLSRCSSNGFN